ncbi:MAG: hypothetical protein AB2L09_02955 [Coriobacteriia bacterium]
MGRKVVCVIVACAVAFLAVTRFWVPSRVYAVAPVVAVPVIVGGTEWLVAVTSAAAAQNAASQNALNQSCAEAASEVGCTVQELSMAQGMVASVFAMTEGELAQSRYATACQNWGAAKAVAAHYYALGGDALDRFKAAASSALIDGVNAIYDLRNLWADFGVDSSGSSWLPSSAPYFDGSLVSQSLFSDMSLWVQNPNSDQFWACLAMLSGLPGCPSGSYLWLDPPDAGFLSVFFLDGSNISCSLHFSAGLLYPMGTSQAVAVCSFMSHYNPGWQDQVAAIFGGSLSTAVVQPLDVSTMPITPDYISTPNVGAGVNADTWTDAATAQPATPNIIPPFVPPIITGTTIGTIGAGTLAGLESAIAGLGNIGADWPSWLQQLIQWLLAPIAAILQAIHDLLAWFGSLFANLETWLFKMFYPNGQQLQMEFEPRWKDLGNKLKGVWPFALIPLAISVIGTFAINNVDSSGLDTAWDFDIADNIHVHISLASLVEPVRQYRWLGAVGVYMMLVFALVRLWRPVVTI